MFKKLFNAFDSANIEFKKACKLADEIVNMESSMQALSDQELQAKFEEFKDRFNNGESLDEMLVEAFAVVRESSNRLLGMKPFYVQLIGGIVLHFGNIAEMRTGELKCTGSEMPEGRERMCKGGREGRREQRS